MAKDDEIVPPNAERHGDDEHGALDIPPYMAGLPRYQDPKVNYPGSDHEAPGPQEMLRAQNRSFGVSVVLVAITIISNMYAYRVASISADAAKRSAAASMRAVRLEEKSRRPHLRFVGDFGQPIFTDMPPGLPISGTSFYCDLKFLNYGRDTALAVWPVFKWSTRDVKDVFTTPSFALLDAADIRDEEQTRRSIKGTSLEEQIEPEGIYEWKDARSIPTEIARQVQSGERWLIVQLEMIYDDRMGRTHHCSACISYSPGGSVTCATGNECGD